MDIGLYNLKYPFRKMISFLLPLFTHINPNLVSWSLVPIGLITAGIYFFAPGSAALYIIGTLLILLRMIVGTLDGLIAIEFKKSTPNGEIINRIAPEVCDIFLMIALCFSSSSYLSIGIPAMGMCWAVTFFGLIGSVVGRKTQSVGPVGQTDRIAALAAFSMLQYLSSTYQWGFDFINLFFWWVIAGSFITIGLRIARTFKTA
jgi:phosphatidylglycerophosphate synthase